MTKEEKIKETYGKFYKELEPFIDENGRLTILWTTIFYDTNYSYLKDSVNNLDIDWEGEHYMIPKSLSGIEDNNRWIKIESEDDLPVGGNYKVICTNYPKPVIGKYAKSANTWVRIYTEYRHVINVTHYKEITEDKLPIY